MRLILGCSSCAIVLNNWPEENPKVRVRLKLGVLRYWFFKGPRFISMTRTYIRYRCFATRAEI